MDFIINLFKVSNTSTPQTVVPINQEIRMIEDYVYERTENKNDRDQRALMKRIENKNRMTLNDAILISHYTQSKN